MARIGLFIIFLVIFFSLNFLEAQEGSILDFNITGYTKTGKKSWELKGKSADISSEEVKLRNLEAKFYEKEEITLTSKEGIFDRKKNLIHLEKDVNVKTKRGIILKTNSLDWNENEKLLISEAPAEILRENVSLKGIGLEAKPDLEIVNLKKDIVLEIGKVNPEEEKIKITCDGPLEIDYGRRIAIFNNNVEVEDREGNITSDIMEVYFDISESKEDVSRWKINRIIAKGNVKIVRGKNISYSQEAVYDAQEKKVILKGKPQLIIYPEEKLSLP